MVTLPIPPIDRSHIILRTCGRYWLLSGLNNGNTMFWYVPTTPNMVAATTAIIEPLPVDISEERYRPSNTDVCPNTCVQIKQDLKLLPICWAVAAGVTRRAVTNKAPMIFTIVTTTAAVITLKNSPIPRAGIPCT